MAVAAWGAWIRGDRARARALAERSVALAPADEPARARRGWRIPCGIETIVGNLAAAIDCIERVIDLSRAGDEALAALARPNLAMALAYAGQLEAAGAELDAARGSLGPEPSPLCLRR